MCKNVVRYLLTATLLGLVANTLWGVSLVINKLEDIGVPSPATAAILFAAAIFLLIEKDTISFIVGSSIYLIYVMITISLVIERGQLNATVFVYSFSLAQMYALFILGCNGTVKPT